LLAEAQEAAEREGRYLSVLCFGALDLSDDLVAALANDHHPEVRDAAILTLRRWLGRDAAQREKLSELLNRKGYNKSEVGAILQLLRIPSAEDFQVRSTYEFLLDHLASEKLAIRELSFWHLIRLTPRELVAANQLGQFDPAGPQEQREVVEKKWRKLLDDGKLPPDLQQHPPRKGRS
jgi:hypothetical protein